MPISSVLRERKSFLMRRMQRLCEADPRCAEAYWYLRGDIGCELRNVIVLAGQRALRCEVAPAHAAR